MECRISSVVLDRCAAESAASRKEICGILVGHARHIAGFTAIPNVAADPRRGFALEPGAHLRAARLARRDGMGVVGHYHSHPSGDARPSARDAARAHEQGVYWLIVTPHEQKLWISRRGGAVEHAFDPVTMIRDALPCNRAPHAPIEVPGRSKQGGQGYEILRIREPALLPPLP